MKTNPTTIPDLASSATLIQNLARARKTPLCPLCASPRKARCVDGVHGLHCERCGDFEEKTMPTLHQDEIGYYATRRETQGEGPEAVPSPTMPLVRWQPTDVHGGSLRIQRAHVGNRQLSVSGSGNYWRAYINGEIVGDVCSTQGAARLAAEEGLRAELAAERGG